MWESQDHQKKHNWGERGTPQRGGGGLIGDFLSWLEAGSATPQTVRLREAHLNRLALQHGLLTITDEEIVDFIRRRGWKPNTVKSFRGTLSTFYDWATKTGRREDNPVEHLRAVKVPEAMPKIATAQALEDALAKANPRDRIALKLAAYAGLRRGEIAAIKYEDIADGWIHVVGKGGRPRRIPVHPLIAEELRGHEGRRGYIFPDRWGEGHVTDDAAGRRIARLLPSGMTAHSLRHMFATRAYRSTRDLRSVQQLLGHSSLSTTQVYVHTDDDELRAAVFGVA